MTDPVLPARASAGPPAGGAPVALVFGGSGQIGGRLLRRLSDSGWAVIALSRQPGRQSSLRGLRWRDGSLADTGPLPETVDAIFSCGPLDGFAQWFAGAPPRCGRVVAFGSTSVGVKRESADPGERDVARRLRMAEEQLFAAAAGRGTAATVLRPTLVYGAGRDMTLTRIAALARRLHGFALPADALGLRQPVHVDDLADAAMACLAAPGSCGRAYDLPGGETIPYRDMVARALAALPEHPRLWTLPPTLFRMLLVPARLAGMASGFTDAALARMRQDLAFDAAPARQDIGYAPRDFAPTAAMLTPPA